MEVETLKTKTDLSLKEINILLDQETNIKTFQKIQYFRFKKMGYTKIEACKLAGLNESSRYYLDDLWEKGGYNALIPHYNGGRKSKLSNEEQLDIVYNELEILVQGVKEFGGFDKVIEQIKNNNGIVDISTKKYKDDSNIQEKNISSSTVDKFENTSEQQSDLGFSKMQADIAELEELKQELLNASSNKKEKTYQKK